MATLFMRFVICSAFVVLSLIGNFMFARRYLLHLDYPADPIAKIRERMAAVSQPVVFRSGRNPYGSSIKQHFIQELHIPAQSLPNSTDFLIDINNVATMNPNPQPLDLLQNREPNYMTYGYIGTDNRYHQITHYWGEADSTPSLLVAKVRGAETGWGDYFVQYTVYLSRDTKPHPLITDSQTGSVIEWQDPSPYPNIDRIDWSSYAGGSYNGFEEMHFSLTATFLESSLAVLVIFIWRRNHSALKPH